MRAEHDGLLLCKIVQVLANTVTLLIKEGFTLSGQTFPTCAGTL